MYQEPTPNSIQDNRCPTKLHSGTMTDSLRRLAPASYCTAALLVFLPMIDYLGSAWPFRPSAANWRYEVAGTISTHLVSPLLGLLLATSSASAQSARASP